jgi:pimeloyl-ACP methyl ester carboxylesterase
VLPFTPVGAGAGMATVADMSAVERIEYDEFGLFHQNAAEYDLPYDGPPTVRRESVEVEPGRSLSALVWGTGEPELVFLHGGSQNAHTWDTVAMALRPRSLVCIDLPGHGHSDGPGDGQRGGAGPLGAAKDVAVVIRALAPNAKAVIGMSFGGLTTIALTREAPELVRKAVIVDAMPGIKGENAQHIVEFVNGPATFPSFSEILERTMQFNPTRSESSMRRGILHNALQLEDGSWVWRHSRWRVDTPVQPVAPGGEQLTPQLRGQLNEELLEVLGAVKVPVLLARGMRQDSVLRDDDENRMRELVPSVEVVRFEDAGHSIQGDMPVELAATISDFVFG